MTQRANEDILLETVDVKGKRVLDIGCGDGRLTHFLVKAGAAEATGVDPNSDQIARARKQTTQGARFLEGVGESLPFPDGSQDVVIFFNSFHHVPVAAMDDALAETFRVLKPGGALCVCEPLAAGSYFETMRPVNDETEVRAEAIEAMARATSGGTFQAVREEFNTWSAPEQSFEVFCRHMTDVDPGRATIIEQKNDELRALFAKNGRKTEHGYEFERSVRFNLFRRV